MTPDAILTTCTQSGIILKWDGSTIKARGEERVISTLLPLLRAHKAELQAYFEADARDFYEERAAILEYDAGLSRAEAETQAKRELAFYQCSYTYH